MKNLENTFQTIKEKLLLRPKDRPFLMAIDGVDCSGKTTFAKKLLEYLKQEGFKVIQAHIDGFHNPREIRYQKGSTPEGYYRDSFNYEALKKVLLEPLKFSKARKHKTAVFDFKTDSEIDQDWQIASLDSVLIFEGVFLQRPEIYEFWDFVIFLDVNWETVIERAIKRDGYLFGSKAVIEQRYQEKYIPGQKLYFIKAKPRDNADLVLQNDQA